MKDYIMEQIRKGKSIDELARELSDLLNDAEAVVNEEKLKAEKVAKKEAEAHDMKLFWVDELLATFDAWAELCGAPELKAADKVDEKEKEDLIKELDYFFITIKEFTDLFSEEEEKKVEEKEKDEDIDLLDLLIKEFIL